LPEAIGTIKLPGRQINGGSSYTKKKTVPYTSFNEEFIVRGTI